mmetsp:Transcript_4006/g.5519  ORF Transcript_4006/g.5519 Transcript_4006/m.5519 type:complete len:302 (-) Transcript_4006:93-998(-)
MPSTVGMMDEGYFVGRREILEWLNQTLLLNLEKIEETASGCVALQLMDACYPGKVSIQKLNWSAKNDYEYVQNYKLLQTAFDKFKVDKYIPVDKIVRAKYQDNLEFMQWFKRYVELTGITENYDPVLARSKGKGAPGCSMRALDIQKISRPVPSRKNTATSVASVNSSVNNVPIANNRAANKPKRTVRSNRSNTSREMSENVEKAKALEDLGQAYLKIEELNEMSEMFRKERDFYFDKLKRVELLLQEKEEAKDCDPDFDAFYKILYATEEESSKKEETNNNTAASAEVDSDFPKDASDFL